MKRRTYVLWKRILARLLLSAVVLGILFVYFRTGALTIHDYAIIGAPDNRVEDLKRQLTYLSEQKLLYVLPGNRIISYHDNEMRIAITEILPNTKTISIRPTGFHKITIKLEQHTPLFSVSDTHAISKEGVIYREIDPVDAYPRIEIGTTTEVTQALLGNIAQLSENISAVLYPVRFIYIDEHNDIRLYDERKKSAVIVSGTFEPEKVWSNILSAVDTRSRAAPRSA